MKIVHRIRSENVQALLRNFPAVLVHGPRQCGKSTLVRTLFPDWMHLDLERPADRTLLQADLEGFLERHPRGLVIDEAQRMPELFAALRYTIDHTPGRGRFVLTGSASPALLRSASETLAGRIGLVELTPFRWRELAGSRHAASRWFWGGYPPVYARRSSREKAEWLDGYVSTFLERDLPTLGVRLPPTRLRLLWTMLTHVHGNLLNVSDLARSLGVSPHTISGDLDVLEATFMVRRLQPYYANVQKRLTKSAKLYVRDTGLLHFLSGLRQPDELTAWHRRGASFEGMVIEEIVAWAAGRMVRPEFFFWRTQAGAEVDLLIVDGRRILPVEIKLGAALDPRSLAGLRQCMQDLSLTRGFVVTTSSERRGIGKGIDVAPWQDLATGRMDLA
jgi:predicted AAA+ superfamily ATPase